MILEETGNSGVDAQPLRCLAPRQRSWASVSILISHARGCRGVGYGAGAGTYTPRYFQLSEGQVAPAAEARLLQKALGVWAIRNGLTSTKTREARTGPMKEIQGNLDFASTVSTATFKKNFSS